jgi:DNA-binding MarR family transcriptional regulator
MNRGNMSTSDKFNDDFITIDGFMSFFKYKTVAQLAEESGLDTKAISKVIKKMLKNGDAIKRGRAYKYPNGR